MKINRRVVFGFSFNIYCDDSLVDFRKTESDYSIIIKKPFRGFLNEISSAGYIDYEKKLNILKMIPSLNGTQPLIYSSPNLYLVNKKPLNDNLDLSGFDFYPCNCIAIDFKGIESDFPYEEKSKAIINKLFYKLRHITNQWWILEGDPFNSIFSCIVKLDKNGKSVNQESSSIDFKTMHGIEQPISNSIFKDACDFSMSNKDTDLSYQYLQDSLKFKYFNDLNRAYHSLATACEVKKDELFYKHNLFFGYNFKLKSYNIYMHLGYQLKKSNYNLTIEDQPDELYEKIKCLWNIRGDSAHGKVSKKGCLEKYNFLELFNAAKQTINWIDEIIEKNTNKSKT